MWNEMTYILTALFSATVGFLAGKKVYYDLYLSAMKLNEELRREKKVA